MARLRFKDMTWDELCPIYVEVDDKFEKIATGVLINVFNNIFLLTASHVIDQAKNIKKEISIPTKNGLQNIGGTLYHRYLQEDENRDDDMLDFSYYKFSPEMIEVLLEDFTPLSENMIEISDDFTFEFDSKIEPIHEKEMMKRMKSLYDNPSPENDQQLKYINNFRIKSTITFAGYPNTKSKFREKHHTSEQSFYHGHGVDKDTYKLYNCTLADNIIAGFGKRGTMNSDFNSTNFSKANGISGGGIYKLVDTEDGLDRKLIGIGHTHKNKQHLFIGTNIDFCLDMMLKRLKSELDIEK